MATLVDVMDWTSYRDEVLAFVGVESPTASEEDMVARWFEVAVSTADAILARTDITDPPQPQFVLAVLDAMKAVWDEHWREAGVRSFTVGQASASLGPQTVGPRQSPIKVMQRELLVALRPYRHGKVQLT